MCGQCCYDNDDKKEAVAAAVIVDAAQTALERSSA